jgi:hypothetical protein
MNMSDLFKSFWEKAGPSGGGFSPKGILIRLGISVAASLIASLLYSTYFGSSDSETNQLSIASEATQLVTATTTMAPPKSETTSPKREVVVEEFVSPVASNPKDGLYLLNDILKPKDWSKLTGGTCPIFVSLVLAESIRLFKWSTDQWIDYSDLLKIDNVGIPLRVKSVDVTNDGNIDYLFEFENPMVGGPKLGAIFAQKECSWHWIDVVDQGLISRTTPYLNHDSNYLSMVDPALGEPFIVNYNELIDRFEVVR